MEKSSANHSEIRTGKVLGATLCSLNCHLKVQRMSNVRQKQPNPSSGGSEVGGGGGSGNRNAVGLA